MQERAMMWLIKHQVDIETRRKMFEILQTVDLEGITDVESALRKIYTLANRKEK